MADATSLQGVGLCHGIAGSGYALLSHGRATGDERQLRRGARLAIFAADHWQELYPVPDAPASLFEVMTASYFRSLLQQVHS
jgi:Lanthionine synthetase C-like protein